MFLRYFVELPLSDGQVERVLGSKPEDWMPGIAQEAEATGERLLASVGVVAAGRRFERKVSIEVGTPVHFPSKTVVPMVWESPEPSRLFPKLVGDLEIGSLGPGRAQLSVSARYEPPLGLIGRSVDRLALHRVAEATVKDFLDRVAAAVAERADRARAANRVGG